MFEILGVIDLRGGRAVRAGGGVRDRYMPVQQVGDRLITPGDAVTLAREYVELGISTLYIADLDAIVHRAPQDGLIRDLAALGTPLWLDVGVTSVEDARRALAGGATRVVIGLETLPSFELLDEICTVVDGDRVVFSLDLRGGDPIGLSEVVAQRSVGDLVLRAGRAGIGALIVLDLARVGMGTGLDFDLIAEIRRTAPTLPLLVGGGVRSTADLVRLAAAGCTGALMATAIQTGALTPADIAAARNLET